MSSLFTNEETPIYSLVGATIKLPLVIKPQAKQSKLLGISNGRLKLAISATPVDGKANKELIAFLAKLLAIKKQNIVILNGLTNPLKLVELPLAAQAKLDEIINDLYDQFNCLW